jgi:hypothetical protein
MESALALTMVFDPGNIPTGDDILALYGPDMVSADVTGSTADIVITPRANQDYADVIDRLTARVIAKFPEARIVQ